MLKLARFSPLPQPQLAAPTPWRLLLVCDNSFRVGVPEKLLPLLPSAPALGTFFSTASGIRHVGQVSDLSSQGWRQDQWKTWGQERVTTSSPCLNRTMQIAQSSESLLPSPFSLTARENTLRRIGEGRTIDGPWQHA